ncbi:MAG: hypothetical protein GC181_03420 [Bacteroidetes bacterium]|nr:hypothetical protein [Bacteroidota bacterium]
MNNTIQFPYKTLLMVTGFAISMALLESAVVIYLRTLMYPDGFEFPLRTLNKNLAVVEICREAATIFMLIAIGWLSGKNGNSRFAWFLHAFAVWDIFYYVFLKVFLNWPASMATWDVLFLIPVMWVGPVWAPVLLSLLMIWLAMIIIKINIRGQIPIGKRWYALIGGAVICIVAFCWDVVIFLQKLSGSKWYDADAIFKSNYVPSHFPLLLFIAGLVTIIAASIDYYRSNKFGKRTLHFGQLM